MCSILGLGTKIPRAAQHGPKKYTTSSLLVLLFVLLGISSMSHSLGNKTINISDPGLPTPITMTFWRDTRDILGICLILALVSSYTCLKPGWGMGLVSRTTGSQGLWTSNFTSYSYVMPQSRCYQLHPPAENSCCSASSPHLEWSDFTLLLVWYDRTLVSPWALNLISLIINEVEHLIASLLITL